MVNFRLETLTANVDYDSKKSLGELRRRVKLIQEQVRREYQRTVQSWEKKPKFYVRSARGPGVIEIVAGTDSELYRGVDLGNPPHVIRARKARVLRFRTGYVAKTTPGVIGSESGGYTDGFVSAQQVQHPGNEPRRFSLIIAESARKRMQRELQDAITEWVRESNSSGDSKFFFF